MEMENTNPSPEVIPNTPPAQGRNPFKLNQSGTFILGIAIIVVLVIAGIGGYFLYQQNNKTASQQPIQQTNIEPSTSVQPETQDTPAILALKDGDLYSVQLSNLENKKLTNGGGFATTNQYGYWLSPDNTKVVSKQNKTLLLITKDGSKPILQIEPKGDVNSVAWRTDNNALVIWQVLKYEETGIGLPILSEILTYDLETGKTTKIKQYNGYGGVAIWDKDSNSIGYTTGGGEGGSFGDYHVLDLASNAEKTFNTRWTNPSVTPDKKEFIVFSDFDEKGNTSNKQVKIYSLLNPDKPLRTFPSPTEFFRCFPQITSNSGHPSNCLGVGKAFWFADGSTLKSFDTQTGAIKEVAALPTVNVDVPSRGNIPGNVQVLDIAKDNKTLLIEQQITFNKSEYKVFNLDSKQAQSLGFTKGGTTQPQGTTGQEGEFWTHEALAFLY